MSKTCQSMAYTLQTESSLLPFKKSLIKNQCNFKWLQEQEGKICWLCFTVWMFTGILLKCFNLSNSPTSGIIPPSDLFVFQLTSCLVKNTQSNRKHEMVQMTSFESQRHIELIPASLVILSVCIHSKTYQELCRYKVALRDFHFNYPERTSWFCNPSGQSWAVLNMFWSLLAKPASALVGLSF